MGKLWLMAKHEYLKTVRQRSFLLATLAIPILIAVGTTIGILVAVAGDEGSAKPLGYVDLSGVIAPEADYDPGEDGLEMRAFEDEAMARASLTTGAIQAYYVVPFDYLETGHVDMYHGVDVPSDRANGAFKRFLRANLLAGQGETIRQRVEDGIDVTLRSADGDREFNESGFINLILPMVAGVFFVFAVMSSGGYLLQAVSTEKENRMIEVMATSLSPIKLIGGKAVGLMGVVFTQLLIWSLTIVVGLLIAAGFWAPVRAVRIPWSLFAIVIAYFIPSYALVAGIMTAIGISVTELREGQQVAGIVNMLFLLPLIFMVLFFIDPNSPLMIALTLFPTTAFITVAMRWGVTIVPVWQLVLSWVLLVAAAGLSVWAAARIFRVGMLRYGQQLDLRTIRDLLRAGSPAENC